MDYSAVKTLDRLVRLLDCFTRERSSWSLAELSAHLDTPKSTLHRFVTGLESHGVLRRDVDDRRWRLGYHLVVWGSVAAESTTLRDLAKPVMRGLATASGETAILTVYHAGEVICIDFCETSHPVRLQMEIGARRPAHAGASAKVLMAYQSQQEIESIVRQHGLPKLSTNTIVQRDALRAELDCIVRQGYAISVEETDHGAWGIATPVRDGRGRVVAAIGLAGPTTRYDSEKAQQFVALCCKAADEITALIDEGSRR